MLDELVELTGSEVDNSAKAIIELADSDAFDTDTLAGLVARFPAALGRRVGYVLEHVTDRDDVELLHAAVVDRSSSPARLARHGQRPGRWASGGTST